MYVVLYPCDHSLNTQFMNFLCCFTIAALWWSLYGGESPELRKLAIRILSQTCSTAARYKLRRALSEQLYAKGRNCIEQQKFADMEFVHNNLSLWNSPYSKDQTDNFGLEDLNPMDDWLVEGS